MPYKEHPRSLELEDSQKIWRFMSFHRFIWLLEYRSLFFSRSDKLGDDYFEGFYPKQRLRGNTLELNLKRAPSELEINDDVAKKYGRQIRNLELDESAEKSLRDIASRQRQTAFSNCWYQSDYESDSLWKVYSLNNGVAIQSTVGRLKKALNFAEQKVYIFKIKYIDYDSETIHADDMVWSFTPLLYKRKQFESEKELRALIFFLPTYETVLQYKDIAGLRVSIEPDALIENLYSRISDQSFLELMDKILLRYGLKIKIRKSSLSEKPL